MARAKKKDATKETVVTEVKAGAVAPIPSDRPTDQELMDKRNAELDAERELHNSKTGGGKYPLSTQR